MSAVSPHFINLAMFLSARDMLLVQHTLLLPHKPDNFHDLLKISRIAAAKLGQVFGNATPAFDLDGPDRVGTHSGF